MVELAARYGLAEPVRIGKIAREHGIPPRFLVQILLQLKGAGYVASLRGAAGGYRLIKSPEEVTLGAIMSVIEGQERLTSSAAVLSPAVSVLMSVWQDIAKSQRKRLEATTLADLVERTREHSGPMYYI